MYSFYHSTSEDVKIGQLSVGQKLDFDYPCESQTDCSPYLISLSPGSYFLEVFGAQGKSAKIGSSTAEGGFGGYSSGVYRSNKPFTLYLHIGGSSPNINGGYNGGGSGNLVNDGPGGGATDFRLKKGRWDEKLESRIIIAGGGGGGYLSDDLEYIFKGGDGGGMNGGEAQCLNPQENKSPIGTQQKSEGGIGSYKEGSSGKGASNYYAGGGG